MSVFDYFWNIEMDKDGIIFSDAIETLKLDCDRALECLKRAGIQQRLSKDRFILC